MCARRRRRRGTLAGFRECAGCWGFDEDVVVKGALTWKIAGGKATKIMQMRVLAVVMAESRICSGLVKREGFWRCDGERVDRCPVHEHEHALGSAPAAVIGAPPAAWLSQAPTPQAHGLCRSGLFHGWPAWNGYKSTQASRPIGKQNQSHLKLSDAQWRCRVVSVKILRTCKSAQVGFEDTLSRACFTPVACRSRRLRNCLEHEHNMYFVCSEAECSSMLSGREQRNPPPPTLVNCLKVCREELQ